MDKLIGWALISSSLLGMTFVLDWRVGVITALICTALWLCRR